MADITRKEKRQIRKKENKEARTEKQINKYLAPEAGQFGIDLDNPQKVPLSEPGKRNITSNIQQIVPKKLAQDLGYLHNAIPKTNFEDPTELDKEALLRSAKKEKRAGFRDRLYSASMELQGRNVDPNNLRRNQLKRARNQEYQNYRGVTERNKAAKKVAEDAHLKQLLDYIDKKVLDEHTTKEERRALEEMRRRATVNEKSQESTADVNDRRTTVGERAQNINEAEFQEKKKANYWDETQQGQTQENPYSDMYTKLPNNDPSMIEEMAKSTGGFATNEMGELEEPLTPDQIGRFSETIINRMYDQDPQTGGMTIKPGMENYMSDLKTASDQVKVLKSELDSRVFGRKDAADDGNWFGRGGKEKFNEDTYDAATAAKKTELEQAQLRLKDLTEGRISQPTPVPTEQPAVGAFDYRTLR